MNPYGWKLEDAAGSKTVFCFVRILCASAAIRVSFVVWNVFEHSGFCVFYCSVALHAATPSFVANPRNSQECDESKTDLFTWADR